MNAEAYATTAALQTNESSMIESDERLLNAIDAAFETIAPGAKNFVYWHLQRFAGLKRTDILSDPRAFVRGLKSIYRDSYFGVERAIAREISTTFNLRYCFETDLATVIFQAEAQIPQTYSSGN